MLLEEQGKYEVTLIANETFKEESKQKSDFKVSIVNYGEKFEFHNINGEDDWYQINGLKYSHETKSQN